jgi:hypothetical protein
VFLSPVTKYKVQGIIKSLRDSYSAGFDEIPVVVVKSNAYYVKNNIDTDL